MVRDRLLRRLDEASRSPLTFVSGPAGSGKSVLLRQWAVREPSALLVSWSGDPTVLDTASSTFASQGVVLVDERDPRRHPLTDADIDALCARLPFGWHLVAARRAPRPDVAAIDDDALAFTEDEIERVLTGVRAESFGDELAARILARTGGWPAGVLLCALEARDGSPQQSVDSCLDRAQRHARSYLKHELMRTISSSDLAFLVRTSTLEYLDEALCNMCAATTDAALRLRRLRTLGVISESRSQSGTKLRCHPMLRASLHDTLLASNPAAVERAVRSAAQWHVRRGDLASALDQFRWLAGDLPRSKRSVLELAALQTMAGQCRQAERTLSNLDWSDLTPEERFASHIIRASWVRHHLPPFKALDAADAAEIDALVVGAPPQFFIGRGVGSGYAMVRLLRGTALWYQGDLRAARDELSAAMTSDEDRHTSMRARGTLALAEAWAGRLELAAELAEATLVFAGRLPNDERQVVVEAHLALAHVMRERRQLDAAWDHVRAARDGNAADETTTGLLIATEQALLRLAEHQPGVGLQELDRCRARNIASARHLSALALATEARLWIASGHPAVARRLLDGQLSNGDDHMLPVAIQAAVADRDLDAALDLLNRWDEPHEPEPLLQRRLWAAIVEHRSGDRTSAAAHLDAALDDAVRGGFRQALTDAGPALRQLLSRSHRARYADHWLFEVLQDRTRPLAPLDLSARELDVLRYLPTRLSTAEIADQLYISRNTVKTHLRVLYRKLGVTDRTAAVQTAITRGLA